MFVSRRQLFLAALLIGAMAGAAPGSAGQPVVNVYTYREVGLLQPLLDRFTAETGIATQVIFAKEGLEQKIAAEGANSPADVLLTTDVARLVQAVELGITQKVASPILDANIPATLRDPAGNWFGLSLRARVVYAARDRVQDAALTYESLASPKWRGRICIRSGQHNYNNALFAAYLARHGETDTEAWLKGLRDNLARKPSGGDRDVAKDIAAGACDVGLGNTYYVGLMQTGSDEQKSWAAAIKVIFPTFVNGGTHVNVSGASIARHAPHRDDAVRLVEWLSGDEAQKVYASTNFEYPVKPGVAADPVVRAWGELKIDDLPLAAIAAHKKDAAAMVDRVAFDEGPGT
jgi:iron(III) transport system substrate-binding protein